jgi:hypothetical protein
MPMRTGWRGAKDDTETGVAGRDMDPQSIGIHDCMIENSTVVRLFWNNGRWTRTTGGPTSRIGLVFRLR